MPGRLPNVRPPCSVDSAPGRWGRGRPHLVVRPPAGNPRSSTPSDRKKIMQLEWRGKEEWKMAKKKPKEAERHFIIFIGIEQQPNKNREKLAGGKARLLVSRFSAPQPKPRSQSLLKQSSSDAIARPAFACFCSLLLLLFGGRHSLPPALCASVGIGVGQAPPIPRAAPPIRRR